MGYWLIFRFFTAALSYFNPLNTPAVSSIEGRYSSGGGSPTHQTATATKRGSKNQAQGNQEKHPGIGTPEWDEKIGGQKPNVSQSLYSGQKFGLECGSPF